MIKYANVKPHIVNKTVDTSNSVYANSQFLYPLKTSVKPIVF